MPTQTQRTPIQPFFIEGDTAPPIKQQLLEDDGTPVDLTGSTVTISIAFSFPRGSYYTSPRDQIVTRAPCVVVGDPTEGNIEYHPRSEGDPDDAFPPNLLYKDDMAPPGEFLYFYQITQADSRTRHVPRSYYLPLKIKAPVGGRWYL